MVNTADRLSVHNQLVTLLEMLTTELTTELMQEEEAIK